MIFIRLNKFQLPHKQIIQIFKEKSIGNNV